MKTVALAGRVPKIPVLAGDDVHVWLVTTSAVESERRQLMAALSADERARTERFFFDRDRVSYAVSRSVLRHLLGGYLGIDARDIQFECGIRGKPRLDHGRLAFNLSHSGDLALIAISRRGDIGVDVEAHRPIPEMESLARQNFSPREVSRLQSLPAAVRTAAFFACWSRKEAYVKAVGDGLAYPLDSFDVTFAPGERARLDVPGDDRWTLVAMAVPAGYAAALVTEGARRVRALTWTSACAQEIA